MAAHEEHERAQAAVLGDDAVVIRKNERGHRRLQAELDRGFFEHLLDELHLVETGPESLETSIMK